MTVSADSSVPTKLLLIDHDHDFFIFFLQLQKFAQKEYKN